MNSLLSISENLRVWFREHEYKGIDPFQLDEKVFGYSGRLPFLKYIRKALKPMHSRIPRAIFSNFSPIYLPKALGLIIGGNSSLYRIKAKREYLDESYQLLDILRQTRSPESRHTSWGWPFEWGQGPRYPKNLPLPCVTSPIGHALLDFYGVTKDDRVLDMAEDVARFLMETNGFYESGGSLCLYYSRVDSNLVYNGNLTTSVFLMRLSQINSSKIQRDFAKKALKFVLDGQNNDGSWYYLAQGGARTVEAIDNRHSGFVLEMLAQMSRVIKDERVQLSLQKGWDYYRGNLLKDHLPKCSPRRVFPVDIHDVAQAIITSTEMQDWNRTMRIIDFAIDEMSNKRDEFYYKYFENGKTNQTVFLRWGQAWMFKALSLFLERQNEIH